MQERKQNQVEQSLTDTATDGKRCMQVQLSTVWLIQYGSWHPLLPTSMCALYIGIDKKAKSIQIL